VRSYDKYTAGAKYPSMWNPAETVMGGGIPIKVVNCPSQDLALTNYAFVNYSDAGTYVLDAADPELKGFVEISGIVLSVRYPSTCNVNLCQKRLLLSVCSSQISACSLTLSC
jgi:hypothetical protein